MAPAAEGTYTVTLTAGTANTSFTINVPGKGGSGGTGPGGVTQVFIISGNGELVAANSFTLEDPLTVLVTDVNGNPLNGVAVNFNVTSGTGYITNPTATTDATGQASTNFVALTPALNGTFEVDTARVRQPRLEDRAASGACRQSAVDGDRPRLSQPAQCGAARTGAGL